MGIVAIFAGTLAPYSPIEVRMEAALRPPWFVQGGDWTYPLGTDHLGRDLLSRMIWGARISLGIAGLAIGLAATLGTMLGLVAGYSRGWTSALIMRIVDVMLTFPAILLALLFTVTIGPSVWSVVAILVLVLWARFARLVRGEVLGLRERDFVKYAQILGLSPVQIAWRHLGPNLINTVVVLATLQLGFAIIVEASLGFLGAGVPPPTPTWGAMVAGGRTYLETAWWIAVFPALAIVLAVLTFNLFGDWVRDALDPRLRQF
jgi:peptide/nickel transport system permease protein